MGNKLAQAQRIIQSGQDCDLDLDEKEINNKELAKLSDLLKNNNTCYALHLKANNFDEQGLEALADSLQTNRFLKRLYLNNNRIGDVRSFKCFIIFTHNLTDGMSTFGQCCETCDCFGND